MHIKDNTGLLFGFPHFTQNTVDDKNKHSHSLAVYMIYGRCVAAEVKCPNAHIQMSNITARTKLLAGRTSPFPKETLVQRQTVYMTGLDVVIMG